MNNTRMRSDQDPDEYRYIMDSCRDRLNACDPPEGPTDVGMSIFYCKLYCPNIRPYAKPT